MPAPKNYSTTSDITPEIKKTLELHRASSMGEQRTDPQKCEEVAGKAKDRSCWSKLFHVLKLLKVELIMFTYMFASTMRSVSTTTLIIEKVCLIHLNQPPNVCQNLTYFNVTKQVVEKMANNYGVGHSMIQLLPSSLLACFVGAWSDKYGRKLPIIVALIGISLDGIGTAVFAGIPHCRVEYIFIPALFTGFSGGIICVLTVLYSYSTDVTTTERRTIKFALLEASLGLSIPVGQAAGGWLFNFFGYVSVFSVSTVCSLFCLVFVFFFLKETKGLNCEESWQVKFKHLWTTQHIVESFRATTKIRPNKGRAQVMLLIVSMSITVLTMATGAIGYLYAYHVYSWNNTKYSTVTAIYSVLGMAALFIVVPVFKRLRFGDATLGFLGSASLLAKYVALGLAFNVTVYFVANLVGMFGGLSALAGRSRLSKVIGKEDTGKVFAFLSTAESLLPIISTVFMSQIFNATLDTYPGAVYMGIAVLLVVPLLIFLWISQLPAPSGEDMHHARLQEGDVENAANGEIQK